VRCFRTVPRSLAEHVLKRLREDPLVWLTTVGRDGTPQPNPVWVLWDGETVLVYNTASARRLRHVRRRPEVALHFDRDGAGAVAVVTGRAWIAEGEPPAHEAPAFMAKYGGLMVMDPERWALTFPVALRIRPMAARGRAPGVSSVHPPPL
jgi:PPOX class probable F420-dependent enzyme